MDLSASILGQGVANKLNERSRSALVTIGSDAFSMRDLARVDCFNFLAARNLDYVVNKHLKVKDTRELFNDVSPIDLAVNRMGSITFAVIGAAFEKVGVGGESPLENWFKKHKVEVHTWHTIKGREDEDRRGENKRRRERKHQRRNEAHNLRLMRAAGRAS